MTILLPDRILRSRRVVTPTGVGDYAVWVANGKISAVTPPAEIPEDFPVEDFEDLVLMPGLVDCHVHINEPGRTEWEGFVTASKAAAAGGVTTLVDMPLNCIPVTTSLAAFQEKLAAVEGKLWVDCGFYGGVIPGNYAELEPLIEAGVLGFKAFLIHSGIDDFPNVTSEDLQTAMPVLARVGVPLLVHAELDCGQAGQPASSLDVSQYPTYLASRPAVWETDAIGMMIDLCKETGCRVHIVHLSAAEALPLIEKARGEGLPLSVETCPHYLSLHAEAVPAGNTCYKCAPPIRGNENQQQLWQGLKNGLIDFIVSDHSPCTPQLKLLEQGDFMQAWGGISSLQLGLSVIWTEAQNRGFDIADIARWMCHNTAQFCGLGHRKGQITPGYDADFVIWDPQGTYTVTEDLILHQHKLTPYNNLTLQGRVIQTVLRGDTVYNMGLLSPGPLGTPLLGEVNVAGGRR